MGAADPGDGGGGCRMVAGQHNRKQALLEGGGHQVGGIGHHPGDRLNVARMGCCGAAVDFGGSGSHPGGRILLAQHLALEQLDPRSGSSGSRSQITIHLHQPHGSEAGRAGELPKGRLQPLTDLPVGVED